MVESDDDYFSGTLKKSLKVYMVKILHPLFSLVIGESLLHDCLLFYKRTVEVTCFNLKKMFQ